MRHLDLFTGIGGFALAASWVWGDEYELIACCENDKFCQQVIRKHYPDVPIVEDIHDLKYDYHEGLSNIDLITGGDPCQPNSVAGKQRGQQDDRWLWPAFKRVVQAFGPAWIIRENVINSKNMDADIVCSDLEALGYETQAFDIPSCSCDLPTLERHLWIIAASTDNGLQRNSKKRIQGQQVSELQRRKVFTSVEGFEREWYLSASRLLRSRKGFPDFVHRIRALANAVPPPVVVPIMQAIKIEMDTETALTEKEG